MQKKTIISASVSDGAERRPLTYKQLVDLFGEKGAKTYAHNAKAAGLTTKCKLSKQTLYKRRVEFEMEKTKKSRRS